MTMVKLCSFAPGQDLTLIRDHLEAQSLAYQLRDLGGAAELWVDDRHLDLAVGVLDSLALRPPVPPASRWILAQAFLSTWPFTIATMLLGLAGFLLVTLAREWLGLFTFTEVKLYASYALTATFTQTYWVDHQWWRLITPAFLHFGLWHILFNSMALWELGRRLEFVLPRYIYLTVLLVTGLAANVVQHLLGSPIFGGLSGVVFGLFGAIAVLYWRTASPILNLPRGLYILALVSLVILPFVLEKAFTVHVANGAHVGGLVAGLVLGAMVPARMVRSLPGQEPPPQPSGDA